MSEVSSIAPESQDAGESAAPWEAMSADVPCLDPSLEACLSRHWGRLCMIVSYRANAELQQRYPVGDLAHEVVVAALEGRGAFVYRGERDFARWISTLARRVVTDWARVTANNPPTVPLTRTSDGGTHAIPVSHLAGPDSTPASRAARNQELQRLSAALASLSQKDRDAIVLVKLERLSIAECAQALNCSYQAAAHRLAHGLQKLAEVLSGAAT